MTTTGLAAEPDATPDASAGSPLGVAWVIATLSSLLSVCVALVVARAVPLGPKLYPDIIASEFPAYNKGRDLLLVLLWLCLFGVVSVLMLRVEPLSKSVSKVALRLERIGEPVGGAWLVVLGGVAAFAFSSSPILLTEPGGSAQMLIQAIQTLWFCSALLPLVFYRPSKEWATRGDAAVGAVCLVAGVLGTISLASLLSRGRAGALLGGSSRMLLLFVLVAFSCAVAARLARSPRLLTRTTLVAQVGVPLLLVGPFVSYLNEDGTVGQAPGAGGVAAGGLMMVLAMMVMALRSLRRDLGATPTLSSRTVIATSGFLASPLAPASSLFLADDFHLGENLIQWDQFGSFGRIPFRSLVPIPGLSGWVYGAVNSILGDTAASFGRAVVVVWVAVALVSATLLCRVVGPRRALVLAPLAATLTGAGLTSTDRFLFIVPSALLLLLPSLRTRPLLWLACWSALGAVNILLIAGTGIAFVVASAPAALGQAIAVFRLAKSTGMAGVIGSIRSWPPWVTGALGIGTLLAVPMLLDALGYLSDQGRSNNLAWGIGFFASRRDALDVVRLGAMDLLRFSGWWLGVPLAGAILYRTIKNRREIVDSNVVICWSVSAALFVLAMTPYSFGRIDGTGMSRSGGVALVVLGVLLPVALFVRACARTLSPGEVRAVALLVAVAFSLQGWPQVDLLGRASLVAPETQGERIDGNSVGLPGLGTALVPTLARLTPGAPDAPIKPIAGLISKMLDADETYLDLSNRQALYQYTNRAVPTPFAAFIYAATEGQQNQMIDALRERPPPVVLLSGPAHQVLGLPQLRAYRVTRWLLEEGYQLFESAEGSRLLVRPDRSNRASEAGLTLMPPSLLDFNMLDPAWSGLPNAWGQSFPEMAWRFKERANLLAESSKGALRFDLTRTSAPRPDFLLLELDCPEGAFQTVELVWVEETAVEHRLSVSAGRKTLVPLGAQASWVAAEKILTLEARAAEGECAPKTLGSLGLFRLVH